MYRKLGFKILVLSLMFIIPLVLGTTNGYGESPGPEQGEKGPIIKAHVTLENAIQDSCTPGAWATLNGSCGKALESVQVFLNVAVALSATEGFLMSGTFEAPGGCKPGDYIIVSVNNLTVVSSSPCIICDESGSYFTTPPQPDKIEFDMRAMRLD